jgi:hypothetical protein
MLEREFTEFAKRWGRHCWFPLLLPAELHTLEEGSYYSGWPYDEQILTV